MNAFLFFEYGFDYWGPILLLLILLLLNAIIMVALGSESQDAANRKERQSIDYNLTPGFIWFVIGTLSYLAARHIGWFSGPFWLKTEYYVVLGFVPMIAYSIAGLFDKRIPVKLEYVVGWLVAVHAFLGVIYILLNS